MVEEPRTDQALLAAFLRDADETAFSEIVQRHGPMVYRVCYRILTDHHESEDAAQATFAVLVRKADTIRRRRSLGSWLHGVARMTALYALRSRGHRRKREEEVAMTYPDAEPSQNDRCEERALTLLDEALAQLSERQREAIVLRHLQGRSIAEAATLVGCASDVLTSRTRDGLNKLRKFFAKRGLSMSGAVVTSVFETEAKAAVPETLLPSILATSQSVAAGASMGATVSGSVLGLTEGAMAVMRIMMLKKAIGFVGIPVIAAGVAVTGTIVVQQRVTPAASQNEAARVPPGAPLAEQPEEMGRVAQREVTLTDLDARTLSAEDPTPLAAKEEPMSTSIDMPAPASESGNTYARGMSAVLRNPNTDMTYDQIMGLTGVAFILQVDTGGPFVGEELDCAWWPNDAWGFELGLPTLAKGAGREIRQIRCDWNSYKADPASEYRRALAPPLERSLRDGKPVLAKVSAGFVVTQVDDQDPPLLGYGTGGKSTQFSQRVIRTERYPWGLYIIGEKTPTGSAAETDLAALRHAIALFNEEAQGPGASKTRFSGRQAWAEWLRLLRTGSACDNNMLIHLRYNRRSAVAYLRDMIDRHSGATATHLSAAADLYQRILDELMKQGLPYSRVQRGEDEQIVRSEYTEMVESVSELEAKATTELEAAAASISAKQ